MNGAILAVPATWFFLFRTRHGLDLRCAGENPKAESNPISCKRCSIPNLKNNPVSNKDEITKKKLK